MNRRSFCVNSSALRQARAPGDPAQRGVVLGHQIEGPGQMDLLPSLRDPRHLQPLRRRLAARSSRVRRTRRAAHRRHPGKGKHARGTLTLHADRGTSMRSKPGAALLIDLDVAKTHSRPHVSDDNPYSEAQFKTLKYRPDFPERFGSIEDARVHCQQFFRWYNHEHRHSGIALMTPETVHYGTAVALTQRRAVTLDAAFAANPIR